MSDEADEAYGFEYRGSFDGFIMVCISRRGSKIELAAKRLVGYVAPAREVRKPLSAADWERLQAALSRADFWALPEFEMPRGLDGSTWTIEGRRGETRHRSNQWEPPPGPYRDLGCLFAGLAGLDLPESC